MDQKIETKPEKAGRRRRGGIVGLVSGDLGDAVVGAAVGAAAGGFAGSISDRNDQKRAGAASDNSEHQLASVCMEALIALDQKDGAAAEAEYQELVELDPDIDTLQRASVEADRVLDMRRERRE